MLINSHSVKAVLISQFAFFISSKAQSYSDRLDQDYRGPVMQITAKYFSAIRLQNGKWCVTDSLQPSIILIEQFNQEGNFIRKEVRTSFDTSITEYNYSTKEKSLWVKKNNSESITETATISQENPDIIKEVITDVSDSSITELIRFLDNQKKTKTLEEKGYDSKGKIIYHTISKNEDDNQGRFWKVRIEDKLKKIIDIFYYQLKKKDKYDNPTEIITTKNGKVIGIRLVTILYYTE